MSNEPLTLIKSLKSTESLLARGAFLFHRGDPVRFLYFVLEGGADLERRQEDGTVLVLQRARSGDVVAEASLHGDRYHCDARGAQSSRLLMIEKSVFLDRFADDAHFALAWTTYLGHQMQSARLRAEILARRTVGARLDLWLAVNGGLPPRGTRRGLADELAVSQEALYRELAKRRQRAAGG